MMALFLKRTSALAALEHFYRWIELADRRVDANIGERQPSASTIRPATELVKRLQALLALSSIRALFLVR
jgi:hypothetical protein